MRARVEPKPSESLSRDAVAFYEALSRLVRVYQFRDRQRICYHDISVTQCYALGVLIRKGPMRLDALAGELYLDKSTSSRVVEDLEGKGYVVRGDDPDDGRAVRIRVTRQGASLHARIEDDLIRDQSDLIATFSPTVRAAATRLIREAARRAEEKFR